METPKKEPEAKGRNGRLEYAWWRNETSNGWAKHVCDLTYNYRVEGGWDFYRLRLPPEQVYLLREFLNECLAHYQLLREREFYARAELEEQTAAARNVPITLRQVPLEFSVSLFQ